ncbi:MAG: molybdopterin molybdotransferase MoeA [Saprospiraceae bacterium]|nr:molybdopterin molybdotransferase MoeA [Saprospiraceae bacterium]
MVSVEEATRHVLENVYKPAEETVLLENAVNRILAEDLVADRDFPPYDRVTMDGIGIAFEAYENGHRQFPIEGVAAAGDPEQILKNPLHCLEVMTGAMCPEGCDTIIRYEDVDIRDGVAFLKIDTVGRGKNIHLQGEDRRKGSVIVRKGSKISPAEIGVAATVGKDTLKVLANPKIAVISSGDELVAVNETPAPHQIRRSNAPTLRALLESHGLEVDEHHLPDDEEIINQSLSTWVQSYDALILSGGVSMGKFDFIPKVLNNLGVESKFYKVTQRPGKPFWFGAYKDKCKVFAFPGNPVSSFMCANRYFLPWWKKSMGVRPFPKVYASLTTDYVFQPDLTYFLQVHTTFSQTGHLTADPITGHGSGDFANLTDVDAFLELPKGRNEFKKGESFPLFWFRS